VLDTARKARLQRLRWTAFLVVGLAYILSFFHRFAPAAVSSDLQQAFDASAAALGGLAATYFYVYTLMQVPTGVLVDTLGPRRTVAVGGVVAGFGSILFGLAPTLALASAGRLLVGLGVSVTFIAMLKLNAAWFRERHFGSLSGLTILMGNVGAVLAASPLAWVLGFVSWRSVFVAVGMLSLLLAVLAWWLVHDHPGRADLPSMRELDGKPAHPPHEGHWYDGLLVVLKNRDTWPGLFVNLGIGGTFFTFAGLWAVPLLRDGYGLDRAAATAHTSLMLAGFAVGAFFIGTLSDRLGRRKPVVLLAGGLYLLCWLPLATARELPPGASHALFLAMGLGASAFTLTWACAKEVNRHALSGMATSVVNTGAFLGTAILQPLVGWAIDRASGGGELDAASFLPGVVLMTGFAAVGLASAFAQRETYCRYVEEGSG
jgi:sugar phosphate permease